MNDDLVRDRVRRYAADVTPDQLPAFSGVALRRKRTRTRQVVGATGAVVALVMAVVLGALFAGTGSVRTPPTSPATLESHLVGPTWQLESAVVKGKFVPWQADTRPTLTFTAQGYDLFDGCNDVDGSLGYGSGTILVAAGSQSAVACPDPQSLQQDLHSFFGGLLHAAVTGHSLTLIGSSTTTTWVAKPGTAPVSLESRLVGPTWHLRALDHDGTALLGVSALEATVSFTAKGYTADDGCNDLEGTVAYADSSIAFSDISGTAMACPATQDLSHVLDALLQGTTEVGMKADRLTLSQGGDLAVLDAGPSTGRTAEAGRPPTGLAAGRWLLESWTLKAKPARANPGPDAPWVQFSAEGVMAFDGCNSHSGLVIYQGLLVRPVKRLTSSTASCAGGSRAVATAFNTLFAHPVNVYVNDDGQRLTLSAGSVVLSLHRDSGVRLSAAVLSLIRPSWVLQSVKAPGVHWHRIATSTATLLLSASGYQASDGCDSQSGDVTFERSGRAITFGDQNGDGECVFGAPGPPKGTLAPDDYLKALRGTVQAALQGSVLTLTADGTVLTFGH